MSTALFIVLVGAVLLFAIVPLMITILYKHFYNKHINNILNKDFGAEVAQKRWLPPFAVFFLALGAEIILTMICSFLYVQFVFKQSASYKLSNAYETIEESQISDTIYENFNGDSVKGYSLNSGVQEDFSYQLYTNENSDMMPSYLLRIEYTGEIDVNSWDDSLSFPGSEDLYGGAMDDFHDKAVNGSNNNAGNDSSDNAGNESEWIESNGNAGNESVGSESKYRVLYIVVNNDLPDLIADGEKITFTLNLYTEKMDEYETDSLGTYNMPKPSASFSLQF